MVSKFLKILLLTRNLLCEFDWNADANAAYNGFLQKCTEFYNKSFPIKFC